MVQMVKNDRPDLIAGPTYRPEHPKGAKDEVKRPEGPQLEVGARRAPRLLVT